MRGASDNLVRARQPSVGRSGEEAAQREDSSGGLQAARELEAERRQAEALFAEQQAARQQLAALRAEVGALKQQRGQRVEQQQAAAEVRYCRAFPACTKWLPRIREVASSHVSAGPFAGAYHQCLEACLVSAVPGSKRPPCPDRAA